MGFTALSLQCRVQACLAVFGAHKVRRMAVDGLTRLATLQTTTKPGLLSRRDHLTQTPDTGGNAIVLILEEVEPADRSLGPSTQLSTGMLIAAVVQVKATIEPSKRGGLHRPSTLIGLFAEPPVEPKWTGVFKPTIHRWYPRSSLGRALGRGPQTQVRCTAPKAQEQDGKKQAHHGLIKPGVEQSAKAEVKHLTIITPTPPTGTEAGRRDPTSSH